MEVHRTHDQPASNEAVGHEGLTDMSVLQRSRNSLSNVTASAAVTGGSASMYDACPAPAALVAADDVKLKSGRSMRFFTSGRASAYHGAGVCGA